MIYSRNLSLYLATQQIYRLHGSLVWEHRSRFNAFLLPMLVGDPESPTKNPSLLFLSRRPGISHAKWFWAEKLRGKPHTNVDGLCCLVNEWNWSQIRTVQTLKRHIKKALVTIGAKSLCAWMGFPTHFLSSNILLIPTQYKFRRNFPPFCQHVPKEAQTICLLLLLCFFLFICEPVFLEWMYTWKSLLCSSKKAQGWVSKTRFSVCLIECDLSGWKPYSGCQLNVVRKLIKSIYLFILQGIQLLQAIVAMLDFQSERLLIPRELATLAKSKQLNCTRRKNKLSCVGNILCNTENLSRHDRDNLFCKHTSFQSLGSYCPIWSHETNNRIPLAFSKGNGIAGNSPRFTKSIKRASWRKVSFSSTSFGSCRCWTFRKQAKNKTKATAWSIQPENPILPGTVFFTVGGMESLFCAKVTNEFSLISIRLRRTTWTKQKNQRETAVPRTALNNCLFKPLGNRRGNSLSCLQEVLNEPRAKLPFIFPYFSCFCVEIRKGNENIFFNKYMRDKGTPKQGQIHRLLFSFSLFCVNAKVRSWFWSGSTHTKQNCLWSLMFKFITFTFLIFKLNSDVIWEGHLCQKLQDSRKLWMAGNFRSCHLVVQSIAASSSSFGFVTFRARQIQKSSSAFRKG